MKKKVLCFLLSLTTFTFIGCSNKNEVPNKTPSNANTTIQANNANPKTPVQFTLSDTSYFYCPFVFNGTDLIFPNPDENNRISTIPDPLPKDILQSKDVTDFANYSADNIVLVNGILYFSNGSEGNALCSFNLSDKTYSKLNENSIHNLIAVDNQLFYLNKFDNNKLYNYDITTKSVKALSSDSVGSFIISGDFIIYENLTDNSKLYSLKIDGTNRQKLTDYTANSFIPFNGELLFFNSSDNNNLYTLNPSTLESKRLSIMNGFQLKILNNSLYFINGDDSNSLYSLSVDLQQSTVTFKPEISEYINSYYLTQAGIFYEKGINVNNIYFKAFSGKA